MAMKFGKKNEVKVNPLAYNFVEEIKKVVYAVAE